MKKKKSLNLYGVKVDGRMTKEASALYPSGNMPKEVKASEIWIAVRISREMHARLKEWARTEELSVSQLVRRIIRDALEKRG